jgi:hypothetical protein
MHTMPSTFLLVTLYVYSVVLAVPTGSPITLSAVEIPVITPAPAIRDVQEYAPHALTRIFED